MGCWVFWCGLTNGWIAAELKQNRKLTFQEKLVTKKTKVKQQASLLKQCVFKENHLFSCDLHAAEHFERRKT